EGPVYALEARGYVGEVNYDGETQTGTPLKTEVAYLGGLGEARVGYRFVADWANYGFDTMAGLGGEYWSRDIQDGSTASGQSVSVDEELDTFNAELSPDPNPSFYASYEVSRATAGGRQAGVTLYYDSYRFDQSPVASSSIGPILQPESDMDVIGLRFGVFL
ncbi:MAG: hypothetical protein ABEJ96_04985, partial [Thiohalorhabdaceae bacterium]